MLAINWLMFGTNNLIKEPLGLVIDNYTKSEKLVDKHVKCFVKPIHIKTLNNPHFYFIDGNFHNILNEKINIGPFAPINLPYDKVAACIAHYVFKSEETYLNHKCGLPRDDTGGGRVIDKTIHTQYNEIENISVKERYNIGIKKYLKIELEAEVVKLEVVEPEPEHELEEVVEPELEPEAKPEVEPELEVVEEVEEVVEPEHEPKPEAKLELEAELEAKAELEPKIELIFEQNKPKKPKKPKKTL